MEVEERWLEERTHPDWMSRLPQKLHQVPLWDLAIPGSHDSMSFSLDMCSPLLRSQPALFRLLDSLLPCCTRPCIHRWSTTQQSVLSIQCELGIRFLDLRIAKKPGRSRKLFFAHGVYTLMTVKVNTQELKLTNTLWAISAGCDLFVVSEKDHPYKQVCLKDHYFSA